MHVKSVQKGLSGSFFHMVSDDRLCDVAHLGSLWYYRVIYFALGTFVLLLDRPDWGIGRVQSIVGMRVAVNFTHADKQMFNY